MKRVSRRLLIAGLTSVLLMGGAATAIGIAVLRSAPAPLSLGSPARAQQPNARPTPGDPLLEACGKASRSASAQGVSGVWVVQPGGVAGYRARERWAELLSPHEAVARTNEVAGWAKLTQAPSGITLDEACFGVSLTTLVSQDQVPGMKMRDRDQNVLDFLHTAAHPVGTFKTMGVNILSGQPKGSRAHVNVTGRLELNGIARDETLSADVEMSGSQMNLVGNTVIVAENYSLELPRAGDFVDVDSHITIEFSVALRRGGGALG